MSMYKGKSSSTYHLHKCQDSCMSACGASGCMQRCISFTYQCTCFACIALCTLRCMCTCPLCRSLLSVVLCVSVLCTRFRRSAAPQHFVPFRFTFPLPLSPFISFAFASYSLSPTPSVKIFRSWRSLSAPHHHILVAVASLLISLQFALSALTPASAGLELCYPFRPDLALYYLSHYSLSLLCYCCNSLCWSLVVGLLLRWFAGIHRSTWHVCDILYFICKILVGRLPAVPSTVTNERMQKRASSVTLVVVVPAVVVVELAFVAAAGRLLIADYARVLTQTCMQNLLNVNMHLKYKYLCICRCYCCYCCRCYSWHSYLCSFHYTYIYTSTVIFIAWVAIANIASYIIILSFKYHPDSHTRVSVDFLLYE